MDRINFSRRRFLKQVGAVAALVLADGNDLPLFAGGADKSAFEILVAGDSLVWGQGLSEENKFYSLVKQWLEKEIFKGSRQVKLKVKAHSGATVIMPPEELEAHRRAGDDIGKIYCPEVNVSFPSIQDQIESAAREYENREAVDLIILNGGITNIGVANTLNPFFSGKKFRRLVHQFCFQEMRRLLDRTARFFPNARIVVIGYFPIISTKSKVNNISRFFLKIIKFPCELQFLITNGISKQFVKILRKKMAKRSEVWFEESNRETLRAIDEINTELGSRRVVFVESPITGETCYATEKTLLWELGRKNLPEDEKYGERKNECRKVFDETRVDPYGKYSTRICEFAATAHPNIEGSKAFAEAVKKNLKPLFS